jgi:hypothetical protein
MNRETLLAAPTPRVQSVEVPGMGEVWLREMTGSERDQYEADQYSRQKSGMELDNFRARLLVRCICDATGALLLKPEDADALGRQPAAAIRVMFDAASAMNGLAEKNS